MILIDKSKQVQNLVLTLTELTTIVSPVYLLVLSNDFTKVVSRFVLSNNQSLDLNRYDLFQLSANTINTLEQGSYTYSVYQSAIETTDETSLGNAIENGKAKVIGTVTQPIIYNSDPTEYVTYNPNND
ncbi:hypothetical protein [Mucilaginibacter sp.]|uniref:hypothetical protein n=1 Tax=Mucilaginibacter sp. TaxID=1882438 RepID=UPI003D1253AB